MAGVGGLFCSGDIPVLVCMVVLREGQVSVRYASSSRRVHDRCIGGVRRSMLQHRTYILNDRGYG